MPTAASSSDPLARREIRVFISSTFRDMMRERDLLVKRVFPALRRICAKRFVTFTEVDLRWGITEEQAAEGKVLPLCLAEIERSRPYFIGLLGERYGWIPDEIPADILAAEPWLAEHVQGRKSVTELEILHGVLNDPEMRGHAFFYYRDPAYGIAPAKFPDVTDDERRELPERDIPWEIDKLGPAEAARRTQERKDKLAVLKQRIRDSKLPVAEPYPNPQTLARLIRRQFTRLIDVLYPEDKTPDPLTQERLMHEAHAKNKLFACIERPAHMAALTAFSELADHGGKGIVVTGESGGGKTALLAAWASSFIHQPSSFLFQHYFGATPDSSSPDGFLRRLLGELKVRFGITDDIPADPDKLREALPLWLAQTVGKGRIVLVLDGLNQLRGSEADRHLVFLPRHFPPHVTVLASALPGPALDALRERGWAQHDLPRASEAEVDAMVGEYFRLLGRHVDTEGRPIQTPLRRQLVAAPGCKNPLFLRTVLEELRQLGSFEQLPVRVAGYLESTTPKELFLAVLRRWQEDFDGKDPKAPDFALTRRALTHLWAAREGLSEPEWLDLLGMDSQSNIQNSASKIDAPLPRAYWTPLFLALETHLSQRAGLFAFGHDFLRQAVEMAFVPSSESQYAAHLVIANYFENHAHQKELTQRKVAEWPHQLHAAQAWDRLENCLTDIPLAISLCDGDSMWQLTGYWHSLRERGRDMGKSYSLAYERWKTVKGNANRNDVTLILAEFLLENGQFSTAEALLLQVYSNHNNHLRIYDHSELRAMHDLGELLSRKGNYVGAEPLLRHAMETREMLLGPDHPHTLLSMTSLAMLLIHNGDYACGEPLSRRAFESCSRILGPENPQTLIAANNFAILLRTIGDVQGAEFLYRKTLETCERLLGPEHRDTLDSVNHLGELLRINRDFASAEPLLRRAFKHRILLLGSEHPDTLSSMNNVALLLLEKGDYADAEQMFREAIAINKRVLGPEHSQTLISIGNLAMLLLNEGDLKGAELLYRQVYDTFKRSLGTANPHTLLAANNLAQTLYQMGEYHSAMTLARLAVTGTVMISRMVGKDHPNLNTYIGCYSGCLEKLGLNLPKIRQKLDEVFE